MQYITIILALITGYLIGRNMDIQKQAQKVLKDLAPKQKIKIINKAQPIEKTEDTTIHP